MALLPWLPMAVRQQIAGQPGIRQGLWPQLLIEYDRCQYSTERQAFRKRMIQLQRSVHPDKWGDADPLIQSTMLDQCTAVNLVMEHLH